MNKQTSRQVASHTQTITNRKNPWNQTQRELSSGETGNKDQQDDTKREAASSFTCDTRQRGGLILHVNAKSHETIKHTHCPQPASLTHRFENGNSLLAEPDRIEDVIMEDRLKKVVFVISFKGRLARHHLIHQYPQGPPVHRRAVIQLLKDLHTCIDTRI